MLNNQCPKMSNKLSHGECRGRKVPQKCYELFELPLKVFSLNKQEQWFLTFGTEQHTKQNKTQFTPIQYYNITITLVLAILG
jgi:hypothetical protein